MFLYLFIGFMLSIYFYETKISSIVDSAKVDLIQNVFTRNTGLTAIVMISIMAVFWFPLILLVMFVETFRDIFLSKLDVMIHEDDTE